MTIARAHLIGAGFIAAALVASQASAQVCNDYDLAVANLSTEYSEEPVVIGTLDGGGAVIFFGSETGSWTAVRVTGRVACEIASGTGWAALELEPQGVDG